MDADQNLVLGALAVQTGLIDADQFRQACKHLSERQNDSMEQVLIERGWLLATDGPHLRHLLQRTLHKHRGDAKATLSKLPSIVRQSFAILEDFDSQVTMVGCVPPLQPDSLDLGTEATSSETRYELAKLHATGGIGRVWVARDRRMNRQVALKDLLPKMSADPKVVARFVQEALLTGQMEHPAIVPVYEVASRTGSDEPFYTMRLVRGRTLTDAANGHHAKRSSGQSDPHEFVRLLTAFTAVCNALAYAHSTGVIHRDLKGENVIVGNFGEVVVLDWGLAKVVGQSDKQFDDNEMGYDPDQSPDLTVQGQILGTPAYMAPEQAEGRLDLVDQRTDIYGLGAILYEVLTGQPPFTGGTTLEVLLKVQRGEIVPPHELWPEVPAALEQVCLKALATDREQRYASAAELGQEVERWQVLQRRQAEDALRRQTEILQSILNSMSDGVLVADVEGNLLLINPAAERILGHPPEPTLAGVRSMNTFFRPDMSTHFEIDDMPLVRAIRGEDVDDAEMFVRRSNAAEGIWTSANARPVRDEAGNIRASVVVFRDITERKRVEQELIRSRERFELAVQGSQDGLWDWDVLNEELYYAPRFKEIMGYADHEIAHRVEEWSERIHPDEREQVLAANYAAIDGKTPHYECEYRLRHRDGSYRWILARGVALRDVTGKGYRMAGSIVDITERKRAEEEREALVQREREVQKGAEEAARAAEEARDALDLSEERFRSLIDLIPAIVWTADADGSIDYVNNFWCNFTGMTLEQTQGSGRTAAVHPDDIQRVAEVWARALRAGEPVEVNYRIKCADDGVYRSFLARSRPMRDRERRIVGWFGVLTLTDHHRGS